MSAIQQQMMSYKAAGGDPNWASVGLLVANNSGANGTTTFTDQSSSAVTMTTAGNAVWSNTSPPTGLTTTLAEDGTGDYLTTPNTSSWKFGAGDFTVEAYVYITSLGTYAMVLQSANPVTWATGWTLDIFSPGKLQLYLNGGLIAQSTANVGTGAWVHVAATRSGTSVRLFINGTQDGSGTSSADLQPTELMYVGGNGSGYSLNGRIASARVTKGVARYTASFTPPTLPLPSA